MAGLDSYLAVNRANWDDRADIHVEDDTGFYGIEALLAGAISLTPIERDELPDVAPTGPRRRPKGDQDGRFCSD